MERDVPKRDLSAVLLHPGRWHVQNIISFLQQIFVSEEDETITEVFDPFMLGALT